MLYVTVYRWTPFCPTVAKRRVIQTDQRKSDDKHPLLSTGRVPLRRAFFWKKSIEAIMRARPRAILRSVFSRDPDVLHGMHRYLTMGHRARFRKIARFLYVDKRIKHGSSVEQFMGASSHADEGA